MTKGLWIGPSSCSPRVRAPDQQDGIPDACETRKFCCKSYTSEGFSCLPSGNGVHVNPDARATLRLRWHTRCTVCKFCADVISASRHGQLCHVALCLFVRRGSLEGLVWNDQCRLGLSCQKKILLGVCLVAVHIECLVAEFATDRRGTRGRAPLGSEALAEAVPVEFPTAGFATGRRGTRGRVPPAEAVPVEFPATGFAADRRGTRGRGGDVGVGGGAERKGFDDKVGARILGNLVWLASGTARVFGAGVIISSTVTPFNSIRAE
ncbi:hypothetical protein FGB62_75g019 [Gracilaria domingensis]|nr:hypothetical protein FGB62_75g019 [Gracilaria domingensis]